MVEAEIEAIGISVEISVIDSCEIAGKVGKKLQVKIINLWYKVKLDGCHNVSMTRFSILYQVGKLKNSSTTGMM